MIRNLALAATFLAALCAPEADPGERSLAVGFGPSEQLHLTLSRNAWGLYAYPFMEFHDNGSATSSEYAIRAGAQFSYTAFAYRRMECRGQIGAGLHGALLNVEGKYAPDYENKQGGLEAWLQPEFRFYERFALLLEACLLKSTWEESSQGSEYRTQTFEMPDFALSELKVGFRFYFQFHKES